MENNDVTPPNERDYKKEFDDLLKSFQEKLIDAEEQLASIRDFRRVIDGDGENPPLLTSANTALESINQKKVDVDTQHSQIVNLYSEIIAPPEGTPKYSEELKALKTSSVEIAKDLQTKKDDIETFHSKIFGKTEGETVIDEGLEQKFDKKLKDFEDIIAAQQVVFKKLAGNVESLLPGATSIGLAKAYEDQRETYRIPLRNWSVVFVFTMLIMAGFGVYYFIEISAIELNIKKSIVGLFNKLPFFVPVIWLAVYASKKQSQYKRLQQEYAFKETFAKSYEGHKRQIVELNYDEENKNKLMAELLTHLVNITSQNPSSTLENKAHNDEPPMTKFLNGIIPVRKSKEDVVSAN